MNPYAAPKSAQHAAAAALGSVDDTDLYVATLPSPSLKVLAGSMFVMAIVLMVLLLRLVASVQGPGLMLFVIGHLAAALPLLPLAWGALSGRAWCLVIACVLSPIAALLSLFALLTASIAGLLGMLLAVLIVVLALMNFAHVRTIGAARLEMRRRAQAA